jgi:hypothetical protein
VPAPYDINGGRVALGLVVGTIVALLYFGLPFAEFGIYVVLFGTPLALGGVLVIVLPAFFLLRRWRRLSIFAAVLVGGVLAMLPYIAYALAYSSDPLFLSSGDDTYLNGHLTAAGWLYFFGKVPLWFFGGGALGGAVGWLIAFGFRLRPQRQAA